MYNDPPTDGPTHQPTDTPIDRPTDTPTKSPVTSSTSQRPNTPSSKPSLSFEPTEGAVVQGTQTGQIKIGNTTGTTRDLLEAIGLDISLANAIGNATQKALYDVACNSNGTSACSVEIASIEKWGAGFIVDYKTIFTINCPTYLCTGVNEQIIALGNATSTKLEEAVMPNSSEMSLLTAITQFLEAYVTATNNTDQSLIALIDKVATLEIEVVNKPVQISYNPIHPLFPTQVSCHVLDYCINFTHLSDVGYFRLQTT